MDASHYKYFNVDELSTDAAFRRWCLQGEEEDQAFWNTFLLRNPEKAAEIQQARQIVLGVDRHFSGQVLSPLTVEQRLRQTLQEAQRSQHSIRRSQRLRTLQIAASIAMVIAFAGLGYHALVRTNEQGLVEYHTEYGQQQTIELPDGSTVQLNANSKLTWNQSWDDDTRREVWLDGEAYFSIEKKPVTQAKFVVHARGLDVEVLGTQFNVNTEEESTQVVLEEGKIKLSTINSTGAKMDTMTLVPGEIAHLSLDTRTIKREQGVTQLYSTWKDGYLTYQEATLAEVLDDVHQTFGYKMVVEDSLLLNETITGALSSNDLDALLTVLEDIMPEISFTRHNKQLLIRSKD